MQKRMKLTSIKRIIKYAKFALAAAIAILAFFLKDTIIQVWRGPLDLASLQGKDMTNQYVTVTVEAAYGKYSSVKSTNNLDVASYVIKAKGFDDLLSAKVENNLKLYDQLSEETKQNNKKTYIEFTGIVKELSEIEKKTCTEHALIMA